MATACDMKGFGACACITIRRGGGFAWQIPLDRKELANILAVMRDVAGLTEMPLEVTLADDASISETNAAYLDCPGPTNILAFPPFAGFGPGLGTNSPGTGLLLLSLDALGREALLYGQDAAEHVLRLLAHGIVHLAGYDHGAPMDSLVGEVFTAGWRSWEKYRAGGIPA